MDESDKDDRRYNGTDGPIHQEFGQRGAIPGLEDFDEDKLFYGPASDGLEYIHMVRTESQAVPRTLRIEPGTVNEDGMDQSNSEDARFEDGAYFSATQDRRHEDQQTSCSSESEDDVQTLYYQALIDRFVCFRDHVRSGPAKAVPKAAATLPKALTSSSKKQWEYEFKHMPPTLRSLIRATQNDISHGVTRVQLLLTRAAVIDDSERTNLACWSWALLGCSRDVGTLDRKDVAILREFAKTALNLATTLQSSRGRNTANVKQTPAIEDMPDPNGDGESLAANAATDLGHDPNKGHDEIVPQSSEANQVAASGLEETRKAMLARLRDAGEGDEAPETADEMRGRSIEEKTEDALKMLDIIVTIVGSVFGQRDLLDMRLAWDEPD